jgi:gas vesicle protein
MKTSDFLFGALVGAIAAHIWYRKGFQKKAISNPKVVAITEEIANVQKAVEEESSKFSSALKEEYDIVMLPNKISKRAKEKGRVFTESRYAIDPTSIKEPLSI